jgi:YesN/AraC family two-component response regulator
MECDDTCDRIVELFEECNFFLIRKASIKDLAKLLNLNLSYLKRIFKYDIEYSFEEMVEIYRTSYAKKIIRCNNIIFEEVWRLSGFNSFKDFKRSWEKVGY